ncbi:MAG: prephenate dehydrogenase [Thermotogaceae bacterium]|jgi:prephenate dehydrogenase|nr:prephenate dehydrogenase [Thermotogaceae bacterium]
MKIFILGAGKMGKWFAEELNHDHEVAIFDWDSKQMKHLFNVKRFKEIQEIKDYNPELVVNCVSLNNTVKAFQEIEAFISDSTILSDITSVKYGLEDYYKKNSRHPFVSTHPMFGPTFANINDLTSENAVIIKESDEFGKKFFREFFSSLKLNIYEYSFEEHDKTMAYSLATPFISSLVFGGCLEEKAVPGTTFKKQMHITRKLMCEDDYLLSEILFNPYTVKQIERIYSQLASLTEIIEKRDFKAMKNYLDTVRRNISNT